MRKFFSLITALVLCTAMWGQTESAYYEVPAGTFFAGMTDNSGKAASEFYVPYRHNYAARDTFRSAVKGTWKSSTEKSGQYIYTYSNVIDWYHIPQLQVEGKTNYQYGASSTTYNSDLYFYIGYPDMHYMTPARLWTDLVTKSTGYQDGYGTGYKTTNSDTMGVYFNNIETMYIDGISIPIALSSATTDVEISKLFTKDNSHVKVAIYHATINGNEKSFDRNSEPIWDSILTKEAYKPYASNKRYRGALNANFTPITIDGAFVIELSEMKASGCVFYVFSDKSIGKNKLGYYIQDAEVSFPGNYCLAVSVHGMFPALEKKDTKATFEFAHTGGDDNFAFISNVDPTSDDFTIDLGADWISKKDITYSKGKYELEQANKDTITYAFTVAPNTGEAREATITLKHHGKALTYTVSQAAAPAPVSTKKTIYCKMEQGWWKADGAAVGCHSWGNPGPGTTWPGVRMTPVEGQTDLWSIELDLDQVQNVIFTRVNASGDIADWGAKTKDLTIPTDDKDLFTITSSSAVWGDPGCDGEWSKYTKPTVITYKDSVYYVAGNFTKWAAEMKKLPAEVELPADSILEFKQVMTRTVLADGVFARNDTIWYGQVSEGEYMTRGNSAWKLDGGFNVLAVTDIEGTYTFSLNANGEFVLGWPASPATNINNVKALDGKRYNILGQIVNETYRGIVIMNGKKIIQ